MAEWDSKLYLKFKKERTQPSIDLANRIEIDNPKKILDIGCGPGNSTAVLKKRFPDAYVLGIDSSENMIESAKKSYPDMDFMICDASTELADLDTDFDIVFSNACIQWIPNHRVLLKNMLDRLKKGGIMAVQTPMNSEEPIQKITKSVANSEKWAGRFSQERFFFNLTQSEYFDLLSEISDGFTMWHTTYCHIMPSHESIIEWYRSTGLRPYLSVLSDSEKTEFEKDILAGLEKEYPKQADGRIIFRFPRFFFTAER